MKIEHIDDICRARLEKTYDKLILDMEEEKKFIDKIFTLQRYYLTSRETPLSLRIQNFEALESMLLASLSELQISFDGTLTSYLDISDLVED